jgi:hypothetical protein
VVIFFLLVPVGIVNKAVGWTVEEWWLESWQEEFFFFCMLLDQFWDSLSFPFSGYWGFFLVANVAEQEAAHAM